MRRIIVVLMVLALVGCGGATANKPISQMTGADWLALSRDDQNAIASGALDVVRCPSRLSANDLAVAVTRRAATERQSRLTAILATVTGDAGCVQSR